MEIHHFYYMAGLAAVGSVIDQLLTIGNGSGVELSAVSILFLLTRIPISRDPPARKRGANI